MASELTKAQRAALAELGEPGHYMVNWRPKLSVSEYDDLKQRGFIAEAWTWASTTRPDVAITHLGRASLAKEGKSDD